MVGIKPLNGLINSRVKTGHRGKTIYIYIYIYKRGKKGPLFLPCGLVPADKTSNGTVRSQDGLPDLKTGKDVMVCKIRGDLRMKLQPMEEAKKSWPKAGRIDLRSAGPVDGLPLKGVGPQI